MPNNLFVIFWKEVNRCYLNNIRCKEMYPNIQPPSHVWSDSLFIYFFLWKGKNIWITRASAFVTTIIIAIIVVVCCHYGCMHIRLFIYLFIYIFLCVYICTYFQKLCHCYVSYICTNVCCCCYCLVFCYLSSYIYIYNIFFRYIYTCIFENCDRLWCYALTLSKPYPRHQGGCCYL